MCHTEEQRDANQREKQLDWKCANDLRNRQSAQIHTDNPANASDTTPTFTLVNMLSVTAVKEQRERSRRSAFGSHPGQSPA